MMEWNENPKQGGKGTAFLRPDGHLCSWLQAIHPPQTRELTGRAGKSTMNESVDAFPMGKSGIFQLVIRFFFPGCLVMKKHPQVWWVLAISLLVLEGLAGWRKNHPKKGLLPILPLVFQKPFFNEGLQQLPFNRFLWCFSLFLSLVSPCCSLPCPPHPAVAQCAMAPRFGLGSGQGSPSHWPGRTTGAERAADGWAAACPGGVAPREGETWRRLLGKIRGGNCEVGNFWVSVW